MSTITKNGTQGPPPKKPTPKKKPIDPDAEDATDTIQRMMGLLEPLIAFHKSEDDLTSDDLRMYWDVRVVRGSGTAFAHVQGTTTLPAMLAPNMVALAPGAIQMEIQEKIARPLTARLQTEAERQSGVGLGNEAREDDSAGEAGAR